MCPFCKSKKYYGKSGQWGITWHCRDCGKQWAGVIHSSSGTPHIQKLLITDHRLKEEILNSTVNEKARPSAPEFRNPSKNVSKDD